MSGVSCLYQPQQPPGNGGCSSRFQIYHETRELGTPFVDVEMWTHAT